MKKTNHRSRRGGGLVFALALFATLSAIAYPPAPPHLIYGMARGEDGEPISPSSKMVLETDQGITVAGSVDPNQAPGVNYSITIPMDAGVTSEPYVENALMPLVPFRISVIIGTTTNLPIEMTGDYVLLGEPGESTRIDLTLGVDSDGDGMPDAWEEFVIALLGGGLTLSDITPGGDNDGDGMSNYAEYIAGTYAFDETDVFELYLSERLPNRAVLQFLGIPNRTYTIEQSENMSEWTATDFSIPANSADEISSYSATGVGMVEVSVLSTNDAIFYRGRVQ